MNRLLMSIFLVFTIIAPSPALAEGGSRAQLEMVYGHGYEPSKTHLMESRNFTIPVWGKVNRADHRSSSLLGHANVTLAITPLAFNDDGSKATQRLTDFSVTYTPLRGQTVFVAMPDNWMGRAVSAFGTPKNATKFLGQAHQGGDQNYNAEIPN